MGEIAEMMLDGTLCAGCGVHLDGEAMGFPVYCAGCRREGRDFVPDRTRPKNRPSALKHPCPHCGRRVKGLADHIRDAHGIAGSAP